MSKYLELRTHITDESYLVEALQNLGYTPEVCREGRSLIGYLGDTRAERAHVIIPLDARGNQLIKTDAPGKVCPADPIQIVVSGGGTGGGGSNPPGSGQPPAMTGVDIALLGGVAVALIAAGVLFARSGRRTRHASLRH